MINLNQITESSSRVRTYRLAQAISIIFLISLAFFAGGAKLWFGAVLVLMLCVGIPYVIYIFLSHQNASFTIDDDKITINHGVVSKHSKTIPFSRVQNVRL